MNSLKIHANAKISFEPMIFFAVILFVSSGGSYAGFAKSMSGDANPPGYSVIHLDIDTVDGPVAVKKSVLGYVHSLEGMTLEVHTNMHA